MTMVPVPYLDKSIEVTVLVNVQVILCVVDHQSMPLVSTLKYAHDEEREQWLSYFASSCLHKSISIY